MNRTHAARFLWKDYRRLRGFWFALLSFWLVGLAGITYLAAANNPVGMRLNGNHVLFAILTTAAFYGLGCAGITFASEHEENTFPYLRSLPVTAESVFYGKLAYSLISTILLVATLIILCLLHQGLVGGWIDYHWQADGIARLQVFAAAGGLPLAMAWGLWCSQRLQRPLKAIGLAAVGSLVTLYVATSVVVLGSDADIPRNPHEAWSAGGWLLLLCLATAAVILGFSRIHANHWLPTTTESRAPRLRRKPAATHPPSSQPFGVARLFWLQLRQSGRSCALWACLGIALGTLGLRGGLPFSLLALLVVGMLGMITFRKDRDRRRYRFLGQLGVRALPYWLSSSLIPLLSTIVISVLMAKSLQTEWPVIENRRDVAWFYPVFFLGLATFGFAQISTLMFHSIVIGMVVTWAAASVAWLWLALNYLLGAPVWLSMFPVAILPLVASYLGIPGWLHATDSRRRWFRPVSALLLLVLGVPLATASFRVLQIPRVDVPFDDDERLLWLGGASPVAKSNGIVYRRVLEQLDQQGQRLPSDRGSVLGLAVAQPAWFRSRLPLDPQQLNELMRLSQRDHCVFPDVPPAGDRSHLGAAVLLADAALQTQAGKLAEAWSRYQAVLSMARQRNDGRSGAFGALVGYEMETNVYQALILWCMADGNSPKRIREAAEWLNEYRRRQPPWTHPLKGGYALTTRLINEPTFPNEFLTEHARWTLQLVRAVAPWELTRARRLRDYLTGLTFRELSEMQADADPEASHNKASQPLPAWVRSNPFPMYVTDFYSYGRAAAEMENQRRATIYQLVAIAYHLEHGAYPQSFDAAEVAPGMQLPDNLFGPGKMKIAASSGSFFVVTGAEYLAESTPLRQQQFRHFLLPDFENWNATSFWQYMRSGATIKSEPKLEEEVDEEADRFQGLDPFNEVNRFEPGGRFLLAQRLAKHHSLQTTVTPMDEAKFD